MKNFLYPFSMICIYETETAGFIGVEKDERRTKMKEQRWVCI